MILGKVDSNPSRGLSENMGCVSGKGVNQGLGGGEMAKTRLGDKLFDKRDKCVDLFCKAALEQIHKSLSQWSTKRKLKAAYDDGIFHLFVIESTPSTRLFLDRSIVKERLVLTDEAPHAPSNSATTAAITSTTIAAAASPIKVQVPKTVELMQYGQTEENLTKPVSMMYALDVFLQPIENTCAYGVWVSWHRQHAAAPSAAGNAQPRKLRLNEGILNSTISIGPEGH